MKIFGEQIKAMKWKTNIGLGLSITSILIAVGSLIYYLKNKE